MQCTIYASNIKVQQCPLQQPPKKGYMIEYNEILPPFLAEKLKGVKITKEGSNIIPKEGRMSLSN